MQAVIIALAIASVLLGALAASLWRLHLRQRQELKRSRGAHLMYEAATRLSGTLDSQQIYLGLLELAGPAIPCDGMVVSSFDAESSTVRCVYLWVNGEHLDPASLPVLPINLASGGGMQTEVIRTGQGRLYADVRDRVRRGGRYFDVSRDGRVRDLAPPDSRPAVARCALMVPIKLEGKVVGIVQMMSDKLGAYSQEHLSLLESLVAPMAVALQNAELYARAHREIAERKRVEQALTESEERLREADKRKDEFLATLAHELRNPLAPIRTTVALLQTDGPEHENLPHGLGVIERQMGHMSRLLDDLLDISRISRGTVPLRTERIDLAEVMGRAVEASRPLIDAGRHELSVSLEGGPIVFTADPTRLAQVLSNLLNNSARYSDAGSPIELYGGRQGDEVVIQVRDRGIGIARERLPRIFEPFLPIDHALEWSRGGLGIGLSLVRRLVELHGGCVEAASEGPGKGSQFTVRLPVGVDPSTDSTASTHAMNAAPVAARRRILVVDDVPDSADSLARLLGKQGHDTRTAYDGEDAVRVALEYRPDVVLLDLGMPVLNGWEAARRIRELGGGKSPQLIAITGWGHDENRERTRAAGFSHHLVKPVDPAMLMRLLAPDEPAGEG